MENIRITNKTIILNYLSKLILEIITKNKINTLWIIYPFQFSLLSLSLEYIE